MQLLTQNTSELSSNPSVFQLPVQGEAYDLVELLGKITDSNQPECQDVDWGVLKGNEIW